MRYLELTTEQAAQAAGFATTQAYIVVTQEGIFLAGLDIPEYLGEITHKAGNDR